jgi:hypothetical protein
MNNVHDMTKIQTRLAVASFSAGVLIACVCIFFIEPIGEIASSAISIVSEFLVLCGALLGIKTSFDIKLKRFQNEIDNLRKNESE